MDKSHIREAKTGIFKGFHPVRQVEVKLVFSHKFGNAVYYAPYRGFVAD
jgi:hypothetical protein